MLYNLDKLTEEHLRQHPGRPFSGHVGNIRWDVWAVSNVFCVQPTDNRISVRSFTKLDNARKYMRLATKWLSMPKTHPQWECTHMQIKQLLKEELVMVSTEEVQDGTS